MGRPVLLFLLLPLLIACEQSEPAPAEETLGKAQPVSLNDSFSDYWYNGEAELNTYRLEQARYGDIHEGHATLIFVTEPFSKSKQVKLDQPQKAGADKVSVMKLNFLRKFNTGIYPYSTMMSSFHPIALESPSTTLKTSFSAQEWCGQTYFQLNQESEYDYRYQGYSYFESEGDVSGELKGVYLEDGLWNLLRIQSDALPLGKIKILPASSFIRLRHHPIKAYQAEAQLKELEGGRMQYVVDYSELSRSLRITFEAAFPHRIVEWQETMSDRSGKEISTMATLMSSQRSPYWQKNGKRDRALRSSLQLPVDHQ